MSKTILDVLKDARNLIGDKDNWCQGSYAKTADGTNCLENNPNAVRFCLVGAINKTNPVEPGRCVASDVGCDAIKYINSKVGVVVHEFNDENDHTMVIAKLDELIKELENA